jgi:hypothetical protein
MKTIMKKLVFIGVISSSSIACTEEQGLTPEKLGVYVEILSALEEPIDSHDLVVKLKSIFGSTVKIKEGFEGDADKRKQYPVELQDTYATIRMSFPLSEKNLLQMPTYNILAASGKSQELHCDSDAKWFENLRIGDLVKMYGPWVSSLDGSQSEYRQSMFVFKRGSLKINAYGCYRADSKDIRVHMVSVKWPKPE